MQRFGEKLPGRAVVLGFDFSKALTATGDTLTGVPVVTITNLFGGDTNPAALLNGSPQIDNTGMRVLVPVLGGLDQNDYVVEVECATSNPEQNVDWNAILPVRQFPSYTGATN